MKLFKLFTPERVKPDPEKIKTVAILENPSPHTPRKKNFNHLYVWMHDVK